jgi:serine/threonine protein kinase
MNVIRQHTDARSSQPSTDAGVAEWLDALAAGVCTQDEFLSQLESLEGDDPDLPWEALSLLDQYLRREIISRDVYVSLKTKVQKRFMGFGSDSAPPAQASSPVSVPAPIPQAPAPSTTVKILTPAPVATGPLRVGDVFRGRFQVTDVLRNDPSGVLFEAVDQFKVDVPDVSHRVAIDVFDEAARSDPGLLQRICNLQSLAHPNIERIYDVDEDRGGLVVIMESLRGVSLSQLVEQGGRLTLAGAQAIIHSVASALTYAHLHNVFHGDVRAEHVFITDIGEVRLRGFERNARDLPPSAKGDRLAFSWLVYELLAGLRKSRQAPHDRAHARRPPGVTRDQWRVLRRTMTGKEATGPNVLTAFAGSASLMGPILFQDSTPRRSRFGVSEWTATAVVAAILVVAGYFVITRGVLNVPQAAAPIAQKAPEPPAVTPVAEKVITPPLAPKTESTAAPEAPPAPRYSRALIDLPSEITSVPGDQPVARIWVRRRESLKGEVSFTWWTESGTAKIDQDFRRVSPRPAIIDDGADGVELLVPLVENPSRDKPRAFYVKIDEPGSNARLGDLTLMQVLIVPPGYVSPEEP